MKSRKIIIINIVCVLLLSTVFLSLPKRILAEETEQIAVISPSPSIEATATPTLEPTPSPTPEEPNLSVIINKQVADLKENMKTLEEIRESIQTPQNVKNETAIRQVALFKIIDISLNENAQTLDILSQIKDLDNNILQDLKKVIESDNAWYQKFISRINLATTPEQLKSLANEIRLHREEVRGLAIRRLVGLILTLQ